MSTITAETTYTAEEIAKNRALWVEALRSEDYRQGKGLLKTSEGAYCCLGVACELAVSSGVLEPYITPSERDGFRSTENPFDGDAYLAPQALMKWLGLASDNGLTAVMLPHATSGMEERVTLAELNDDYDFTFAEIADLIEDGQVLVADS